MRFEKPPLTIKQQADLLCQRGLVGDPDRMQQCLKVVSYYRLSGYWYPFRRSDDTFKPDTSFAEVWTRYAFDRQLRLLVMDAIERIEVAVRSKLAHYHATAHGAFAYATEPSSLPKLTSGDRTSFLERAEDETRRSKESFVKHFKAKYGDCHKHLPVWMMAEVMTFGTLLTFFRGSSHRVKQDVASEFGMPAKVFRSWLLTLNMVRNICAHHGRLWNRELGLKPLIPRPGKYPEWHNPVPVGNNRMFCVLTICQYCLRKLDSDSDWAWQLHSLLREHPDIPQLAMGIPDNWQDCPIWKGAQGDSGDQHELAQ